jgi:hypothetical protein
MSRWPFLPAVVFVGLAASSGRAQDKGAVEIEWIAPEGCPSAGAVNAQVGELLRGGHARPAPDLAVRAVVGRALQWSVGIETRTASSSGRRTLEASTCEGLANATALIVALMIDPDAVATHAKPSEPAATKPVTGPSPVVVPARAISGLFGIGAAGHLGVLPGVDAGPALMAGLASTSWRAELRVLAGVRSVSSDPLSNPEDALGRFRFYAATLAGCYTISRPLLELGPCLDVETGWLRGTGVGVSLTGEENIAWFGLGAGGFVALKTNAWLSILVHADAVAPLRRPNFKFNNVTQPIYRSPPIGGRLAVGIEARF